MEDNKAEIGQRILEFRKAKGYSQQQLAEKIGYSSKASINMIENGKHSIPSSKLKKIAVALGVDVSQIVEGIKISSEENEQKAKFVESLPHIPTRTSDLLFDAIDGLSENDILKTIQIIEVLKNGRM